MEDGETDELGYLAMYGVMLVPPPPRESGGWFVTLAKWDAEDEVYSASTEGPIFETREEALAEANKVLEWVADRGERDDLFQYWELMQRASAGKELASENPRTYGRWW